ncbi:sigma-70 family RNA polymerase sigma factor [Halomonas beimenensis]|uniref:Sigma-24 (FecI-like) n=1 Tax=Halomonas beimenensis TaxID=475662 RepID=A0A291PA09_9GAMM|nr:sigma-70 family RNA polymerase sigma factor [Halomonas beimenensis]ATJ83682.1 sigma-24 (FecI-like) [Halomonas beimenensis]
MSDVTGSSSTPRGAPHPPSPNAPSPDDRLGPLLQRVAGRDRQAFVELYEATSGKLYGTVLRILKDRARTDDVMQEVYVAIWRKAAQFDVGRASPMTWLVTIARHRAIDDLRRRPAAPQETEEALEHAASGEPGARERLERDQEARRLHACLDELEAIRRDMVRLAYLEGWSRAELAAHFEQPVNTVKTWLHRALKQLKGCLAS